MNCVYDTVSSIPAKLGTRRRLAGIDAAPAAIALLLRSVYRIQELKYF
jgi:hypothetical protein